ncbi:MAG: hypothetical protein RBR86_09425 [Pseudobdellovibrionaceae bacterium]|jgi:hypothetical protein|nr:hypothetical protein [Pseudobdellovibrionaceae bacterium]
MTSNVFISSTLKKTLSKISTEADFSLTQGAGQVISGLLKNSKRDFLAVLSGFEKNLELLEAALTDTQEAIAILEEAGGQTIRARNMAETQDFQQKFSEQIAQCADWYKRSLLKLDNHIRNSGDGKDINLLNGDALIIRFDLQDDSTLITQGINLTPLGLGIREPDFSNAHTIQNSRIDISNAIDLATTLKNMVSSDIATIKTRREFCEIAMSFLTQAQESLADGKTDLFTDDVLEQLFSESDLLNTDESLALDAQGDLLKVFKYQQDIRANL